MGRGLFHTCLRNFGDQWEEGARAPVCPEEIRWLGRSVEKFLRNFEVEENDKKTSRILVEKRKDSLLLEMLKVLVKHKLFIGTSVFIGGVCGIINNSDADLSLSFASPPPQKSQDGKIVWIVGASSGIGASLAIDMAKAGAKVVVSARRQNLLENVARDCEKFFGVKPMILPLDITA